MNFRSARVTLLLVLFPASALVARPPQNEPTYVDPRVAPGMTSCTTHQGCKKCGVSDKTKQLECYTAYMENGECKCSATTGAQGVSGCKLEGTCTYKK